MTCKHCNAELPEGSVFCPNCGGTQDVHEEIVDAKADKKAAKEAAKEAKAAAKEVARAEKEAIKRSKAVAKEETVQEVDVVEESPVAPVVGTYSETVEEKAEAEVSDEIVEEYVDKKEKKAKKEKKVKEKKEKAPKAPVSEKKKQAIGIEMFTYGILSVYMMFQMPVVSIILAVIEFIKKGIYKKKCGDYEGLAVAGNVLGGFGFAMSLYQIISAILTIVSILAIYAIYFIIVFLVMIMVPM